MTVETEVAALTSAVNLLTSTVNVSKATLDASVAAAEAAYDSFDDRYLGAKVSAPSLDNDGGSLLTGALYFNSTENAMYVYTGASWVITTNYNNVTAPYTLAQTLNTNGNNVTFGDNGKAIFGAGSDLQIYHDGGHSYIDDSGTGLLRLRSSTIYLEKYTGELMADFNADGHVSLLHDNSEKFRTTTSGIDVTGTATMDGLTVTDASSSLLSLMEDGNSGADVEYDGANNNFVISTGTSGSGSQTPRLTIQRDSGDISFYEDTGTTPKLFWDASAESLGIGTSSPSAGLQVAKGSSTIPAAGASTSSACFGNDASDDNYGVVVGANSNGVGYISSQRTDGTATTYNLSIQPNGGNVGIGTSAPLQALHVNSGTGNSAAIFESTDSTSQIWLKDSASSTTYQTGLGCLGDNLLFNNGGERMRIDSSGNLLVGTTDAAPWSNGTNTSSDNGIAARADGILAASAYKSTANSGNVAIFNRTGTDGPIQSFYKSGTTVGSIGTVGGELYIESGDVGLQFNASGNNIVPYANGFQDAVTSIGASGNRFKDLYLSGGVYLGGTGAANKLDDYETGTWTPTAANYDGTMTVTSATYVKVGKLVTVKAKVSFDATADGSGVNISGLPFTTTGTAKANGGFVTSSTVSSAVRIQALGTGSIYLLGADNSNVAYTTMSSTTLEFVMIYEAA